MVNGTMMDLFKDPFFIGVDRELNRLMHVHGAATKQSYPPYDILQLNEDEYEIHLAVAGLFRENLEVTVKDGILVITGTKSEADAKTYLHKGIAMRNFTRTFALGEYMEVVSAEMEGSLLVIKIKRDLPEEKKPKQITIK